MKTDPNPAPFKIEMEFNADSESKELIEELVWSYRRAFLPDVEDQNASDYNKLQKESQVAWSSLSAAFGHHKELKPLQERLKRHHLEVADTAQDGGVIAQLLEWKAEIPWPDGHDNGRWECFVESAEECGEITSDFMEDKFWPFIKVIRIYLKATVLEGGLVLVDSPGLRDVNLAKVKATEESLLKADHIFIVARIDRAISNQSIKDSLFSVLRQHVPNELEDHGVDNLNVTVVCTRAEVSDSAEATQLKKTYVSKRKSIDKREVEELEKQRKDRASTTAERKKAKRKLRHKLMKARIEDGLCRWSIVDA